MVVDPRASGSSGLSSDARSTRMAHLCHSRMDLAVMHDAAFLTTIGTHYQLFLKNKLRLCHDRDELTIHRCDARLPHHRSPPAMQGRRFADNPSADGCGAYEVGFAFDRGGTAPIRQVRERSKRT